MAIISVLAVIPVAEFDDACDWYESFVGRPADRGRRLLVTCAHADGNQLGLLEATG